METKQAASWSRGQLEHVETCPACGSNKRAAIVFERCDNDAFMPDKWRMPQCRDCSSIWLDPRPDSVSLPRAYDNYYTHNVESEEVSHTGSSGLIWKLINGYLNRRFNMQRQPVSKLGYILFSLIEPLRLKLDYYGRHLNYARLGKPGKLLDIGCGNGAFLARATEMGWQVQGCEVDPKAVTTCRNIGLDVIEGDAFQPAFTADSFDVITMSHVIEHVVDQQALLRRVNTLLRPGGILWLAAPNPKSIGLGLFRSSWSELHPPCHLSIPSAKVLKSWLKEEGFSDIINMRRGAHTKRVWLPSKRIAQREQIVEPSDTKLLIWRLSADLLSTFSSRWAEETVLFARKPEKVDASK